MGGLILLSLVAFVLLVLIIRANTRNIILRTSLQAAVDREQLIQSQKKELLKAKEDAEAASRAKSVFLSNMSHELRTPLNAILGYCQIFRQDTTLSPRQMSGIRTVYQAGEHLLLLINDILDLSKIESGKMELVKTEFRLDEFFKGVADIVRIRSAAKGLEFHCDIEGRLPVAIVGDELRLRQVLLNLLNNAVKFTTHGYCALSVKCQYVKEQKVRLEFVVEDSGPGIPQEIQEEIFQPFQQAGDRLKYAEGSGLGLAIARRLVRLMGGELTLCSPVPGSRSDEAPGCRFSFALEVEFLADVIAAPEPVREAMVIGYIARNSRSITVLLVDDNKSNRKVLRDTLTPLGFVVHEVADGGGVEQACRECRPDIILMDLHMPHEDGFSATRRLKNHPEYSGIPIVAITASVADEEKIRKRCEEFGFSGYINKPYSIDMLINQIKKNIDIEFVYEKPSSSSCEEDNLVLPDFSLIESLITLSESGDVDGILKKVELISELDNGRYRAFSDIIRSMADDFQLMAIEKFAQSCLEK